MEDLMSRSTLVDYSTPQQHFLYCFANCAIPPFLFSSFKCVLTRGASRPDLQETVQTVALNFCALSPHARSIEQTLSCPVLPECSHPADASTTLQPGVARLKFRCCPVLEGAYALQDVSADLHNVRLCIPVSAPLKRQEQPHWHSVWTRTKASAQADHPAGNSGPDVRWFWTPVAAGCTAAGGLSTWLMRSACSRCAG